MYCKGRGVEVYDCLLDIEVVFLICSFFFGKLIICLLSVMVVEDGKDIFDKELLFLMESKFLVLWIFLLGNCFILLFVEFCVVIFVGILFELLVWRIFFLVLYFFLRR